MKALITGIIGLIIGVALTLFFATEESHDMASDTADSVSNTEPLYWVAPMDPAYRRDKPGKSPMGMDLVPVYAQDSQQNKQVGVIKIEPDVINNLGVRTAKVIRQALHVPINTVGYVGYNQDTLVHIHPRVEGWVDKLYVKTTGQKVEQGEPLYALYSPQLVNAQEEFLLARNRQNTSLTTAALERLKALQMPAAAITQLSNTGKVQQTVIFSSPQSGVVDNLNIREGFFVKPGSTILSIGALDEVWVEAEVFERQASLVKADLPATMTLGFLPGEVWQGKLDYIYPTLDAVTRTVRVRLRFANPQRKLKPNMFAQITIHSDLNQDSLLVPKEAVIRTGQQDRVVLALGQGQFKSVEVKLGLVTADKAQILSGLAVDEEVVTSAQFLLDSESSISSDFKRMHHGDDEQAALTMESDSHKEPVATSQPSMQSATVSGQILQIDRAKRVLSIHREAITKWQRPAATVDFTLAESINIGQLKIQQTLSFSFEIRDGEFVITDIIPDHSNPMQMESKP
ncbi:efflux RND transporter periplasmic adaptor subunit [Paraglaciecola sp.]|uniref:efflux RND transporter periplasmic adaptor subunit n=1 Tax=Paraglaciecola sp. TaxID=1920173 RepID=UPI0030F40490